MHNASRLVSRRTQLVCRLALVTGLLACGGPAPGALESGTPQPPERLRAEVLETLPHDPNAFTQGFEISDGILYESTGRVGESTMSATELSSGTELARAELPAPLFGEGMTVTDSSVWQLTWQDGIAIERDPSTLAERRRVRYDGEGWGLCHQTEANRLVMSDGSDVLTFRDPVSFAPLGDVAVRSAGQHVDRLNELECVGDVVYANVWQTDTILRIDPGKSVVTGEIDASGLLSAAERANTDVLNGIAAIPGRDEFLITGKLWPTMFRVRFTTS
ncbi:MAG: glutaminyl-peptide cyclotransferase [Haloechinothrix sp.]